MVVCWNNLQRQKRDLAICCNTNQRMITSSKYCFFWQEENICPTDCWKFLFIVEHQLHIWTNIKLLNEADGDFNLIMVSWRIIFFFHMGWFWNMYSYLRCLDCSTATYVCGVYAHIPSSSFLQHCFFRSFIMVDVCS